MKAFQIGGILLAALLGCAALAGCSSTADYGRALVPAGNYDLYDCTQLEKLATTLADRERQLEKLIARAQQGAGGSFIATMSYEPEYASVKTKLKDIRAVMAQRRCQSAQPAGRSATTIR